MLVTLVLACLPEKPIADTDTGGGTIDSEVPCEESDWYADGDGDGFGAGDAVSACEAPSGHVADNTDCDDARADVYPDAVEPCDFADNDCDGETDEDGETRWYVDADGDEFGNIADPGELACGAPESKVADNTDCDDDRAETNPGADEYCNNLDDDCDGTVDEDDAVDATTWNRDADQDGFGDATTTHTSCDAPDGYIANDDDCDDTDDDVRPGADEYCNDEDDDCDGTIDEDDAVDASTWYLDSDGDGYGNGAYDTTACDEPSGYTADATDCQDGDADVNPGADELCSTVYDDDCDGDINEDSAADATTFYIDSDSDGYGDSTVARDYCEAPSGYVADDTDCDDGNGDIHPNADEYCNDEDDDCDGTIDEDDAVDATTWYEDRDLDGYGGTTTAVQCDQPSGYESVDGDCDDSDDDVYPGADEYCNGDDDDCDGDTDEDDALDAETYYVDSDGDGYGDASSTATSCYGGSGLSTDDTDCDDTLNAVNPGATEICDNGIDDDCDDEIGSDCGPYDTVQLSGADVILRGYESSDAFGDAVTMGDVDGDGTQDLIAAAIYGVEGGGYDRGGAYIFSGPLSGELTAESDHDYDITHSDYYYYGYDVTVVGDLDGDGSDDLALSNIYDGSYTGTVNLFMGPITGDATSGGADVEHTGTGYYSYLGYRIEPFDDQDGDGTDEWLASEPHRITAYGDWDYIGGVQVYSGDDSSSVGSIVGETDGAYAGIGLDGSGDYDGDGANDIVVGTGQDEAWIVYGPLTSTIYEGDVDVVLTGPSGGNAGVAVETLGDQNGDGYDDLSVGANNYDSKGYVYVMNGPVTADARLSSDRDAVLKGPASGSAGSSLAGCDVDQDGYADIYAGAPYTGSYKGKTYLLLGPLTGSYAMASARDGELAGEATSNYAGSKGALHCQDFDADGYDDLFIGAYGNDSSTGAAYLIRGGGGL
ncbi:MAG: hypothetical protein GY913_32480 [Proteobacteria bacterium]|nr:hypothetical protein [Pseudomonadota bacterium]MCP4921639.1 hypothetical protein [Pseudomonadota bacterium]